MLLGLGLYLYQRGHGSDGPTQSATAESGGVAAFGGRDVVAAGRDAYTAGGDLHVITPSPASPSRDEKIRAIEDEISHVLRRLRQVEENGKEWASIWPHEYAPYQNLPAEKWNAYGASLSLPTDDHMALREAYELENDFNVTMQRGPRHFGDPEPDLEAVRRAFEHAASVLAAAKGGQTSRVTNPYARAAQLQSRMERDALRVAMRTVGEVELQNLARPRLNALIKKRATSMQLATAQWTKYEELITKHASDHAFQTTTAAYRSVVDLHLDLGLETRTKKLSNQEIERVKSALSDVDAAVQALRADSP